MLIPSKRENLQDHKIKTVTLFFAKPFSLMYLILITTFNSIQYRKQIITRIIKGTGGLGSWRPSKLLHYWERPEESGDVRRLAVTETPVKDHQLMLMWKTLIIIIIIIMGWQRWNHQSHNKRMQQISAEDLPASKTVLTHRYNGSKTTWENTNED